MATKVDGLLFDKDGTLFEFSATWDSWALSVIRHYSAGDDHIAQRLARTILFDLEAQHFLPTLLLDNSIDARPQLEALCPTRRHADGWVTARSTAGTSIGTGEFDLTFLLA